ncbi:hypothetical protein [Brevundimonas sp. EYE_349]|uniref:hypothetical protein n=1 Tax=Brevundimonas sp. EYE_349 TaxID=2853455 RepID=UPI002006A734|nr:hypothetical protein [Brevundimonas sp. EYE_349]MCK6103435.1 hypothetical protein [Brevundimonas sp. EYE_349]
MNDLGRLMIVNHTEWLACTGLLALIIFAAVGPAAANERSGPCRQLTPSTFVISGLIDADLATCVERALVPTTTELVLTSRGGSAGEAMRIAERFERRGLTMRVVGECNSSCANYLLPLARRLIVEPGAVIVIHGGIDPSLISRTQAAANGMADSGVDLEAIAAQQRAFMNRNGINPGWLLYREAGSTAVERLDGAWADFDANTKAWLVEETMARSCLPNTIVEYQIDRRGEWLGESRRRALRRQNVARSNTVVCN